jgi:tetratricopeptide (TPR) repeat protein
MPQPASIVAKSTLETSSSNNSATTGETASTDANQATSQTVTAASAAQTVSEEGVTEVGTEENSNSQKPAIESDSGYAPAIDTTREATVADSPVAAELGVVATSSQSKSAEDILQDPVISKTQPSQAVLAAVTPAIQDNAVARQPFAVAINPVGNTNDNVMTTNTVTASTTGTVTVTELPLLKSEPGKRQEVPQFAVLTANDRVQNAITLLNAGDEQRAEKELADALVIEPNNRSARKLMQQLHESPEDFFTEEEMFEYVLKPNESLFSVAEKFLEDPLDFYMLAKLNDIKYPNSLVSGKRLMIPGENRLEQDSDSKPPLPQADSHEAPHTDPESVKNEDDIKIERAKVYFAEHRYQEAIDLLTPYANKIPVSKYAPLRELLAQSYQALVTGMIKKGDLLEAQATLESSVEALPGNKPLKEQLAQVRNARESERLYRLGVQESQTGKQDQAIKTFAKALQLNPEHKQAKKQITDLRLTVVESYHKQAMVLYRKQELSNAIEIWDMVLQLDPDYELAKQYRARALELKRKIEQL